MKNLFKILLIIFMIITVLVSCETDEMFDEVLLTGKWKSGTLYYRYFSDGTGYTWDEADDINENEAQNFTWTLVRSTLTHIHILEIGGTVPKIYTVTELTETNLKYKDDFGKSYSFVKVN